MVGKKEQDDNTVSVRGREDGDLGSMSVEEFIRRIANESYVCTTC